MHQSSVFMNKAIEDTKDGSQKSPYSKNTEKFINQFKSNFVFVHDEPTEVNEAEEWTDITFMLNQQGLIEDIVANLENQLDAHLLYAYNTKEGKQIQAVMYIKPTETDKTSIRLTSNMYGVLDELHITLFNDLFSMYGALSEDVDTQKKLHRELFEYINKEELMKDFI